jgi:hypothetical protein
LIFFLISSINILLIENLTSLFFNDCILWDNFNLETQATIKFERLAWVDLCFFSYNWIFSIPSIYEVIPISCVGSRVLRVNSGQVCFVIFIYMLLSRVKFVWFKMVFKIDFFFMILSFLIFFSYQT